MVTINAVYDGDLSCIATHGPSGCELRTDAPVDNAGKGRSFSPTDLMATYDAGGAGVIFSPNYASMNLSNLDGAARALRELGLK